MDGHLQSTLGRNLVAQECQPCCLYVDQVEVDIESSLPVVRGLTTGPEKTISVGNLCPGAQRSEPSSWKKNAYPYKFISRCHDSSGSSIMYLYS